MITLPNNCEYDSESNTLTVGHYGGFFSMCSITLERLLYLHKEVTKKPVRIYWKSDIWNKPDGQKRNTFELYFNQCQCSDDISIKPSTKIPYLTNNSNNDILSDEILDVVDKYFDLNDDVKNLKLLLAKKYSIDFENTVAVFYRGTDKYSEIPQIHPCHYVNAYKRYVKNIGTHRVLLQTDQKQALEYFKKHIKSETYNVEELPVTDGEIVVHNLEGISTHELGKNYLSMIYNISQCKYIIMDTGNGPSWIYFFRKSLANTYQFFPQLTSFNRIGEMGNEKIPSV